MAQKKDLVVPMLLFFIIFFSVFNSTQASQFIFSINSCFSGGFIETFKQLQSLDQFLHKFSDDSLQLEILFQLLLFATDFPIITLKNAISHLAKSDLPYFTPFQIPSLLKIANLMISHKFPSFQHLVSFSNSKPNSDMSPDIHFISDSKIKYYQEFYIIHEILHRFDAEAACEFFSLMLNDHMIELINRFFNDPSFNSFLAFLNQNKTIHIPFNAKYIDTNKYVTILTSADSDEPSKLYPQRKLQIGDQIITSIFGSYCRSIFIDILLLNPLPSLRPDTFYQKLLSEPVLRNQNPQFFQSQSFVTFSMYYLKDDSVRITQSKQTILKASDNTTNDEFLEEEEVFDDNDSSKQSKSKYSVPFIDASSDIEIHIEIPEEDKLYHLFHYLNDAPVDYYENMTAEIFKSFCKKFNDNLASFGLNPMKLYAYDKAPNVDEPFLLLYDAIFETGIEIYKIDAIPHFSYYKKSLAFYFQTHTDKLEQSIEACLSAFQSLNSLSYFKYNGNNPEFDVKGHSKQILNSIFSDK